MRNFVVFEGIDGTGKGTMIERAVVYLKKRFGEDQVVRSKDPGGTPLGLAIRRVMYKEVPTTQMAKGVVDLLFLASHLQNWHTVVNPALSSGKIVVSDRWWYSQAAYMTQRVVPTPIAKAYMDGHGKNADLLIFLYGDVKTVVDRARAREAETHQSTKAWNNYVVLEKVQQAYLDLFKHLPEWWPVCIDGKSPDLVWQEVQHALDFTQQ